MNVLFITCFLEYIELDTFIYILTDIILTHGHIHNEVNPRLEKYALFGYNATSEGPKLVSLLVVHHSLIAII